MTRKRTAAQRELDELLSATAELFDRKKPKQDEEAAYKAITTKISANVSKIQGLYEILTDIAETNREEIDYSLYREFCTILVILDELNSDLNDANSLIHTAMYLNKTTDYIESVVLDINQILVQLDIDPIAIDVIDEEALDAPITVPVAAAEESDYDSEDELTLGELARQYLEEQAAAYISDDEITAQPNGDVSTLEESNDKESEGITTPEAEMSDTDEKTEVASSVPTFYDPFFGVTEITGYYNPAEDPDIIEYDYTTVLYNNLKEQTLSHVETSCSVRKNIEFYNNVIADLQSFLTNPEFSADAQERLSVTYYKLGKMLNHRGDHAEATAAFSQAIETASNNEAAGDIMGSIAQHCPNLILFAEEATISGDVAIVI